MKYLIAPVLLAALLLGCATQYPPNKSTSSYPTQTINKVGIISTEIFGLTVGMSPRRVLVEFQRNNWHLDSLSSITLEDMVESGIRDAGFYISTNNEPESNLEIHFRNNKVIFLRQTFSISEEQLQSELEKAKSHLSRLGHFDEEVKALSIKLVYKPYLTGYVYYNFHKLIPNQKGYRVWFAVADYGL